jgi:hypothetical protein
MALELIKSIRFTERWGILSPIFKNNKLNWEFKTRTDSKELRIWKGGLDGTTRVLSIGNVKPNENEILEGDSKSSKIAKYLDPIKYNKNLNNISWSYSEFGENSFIFQYLATQAAIIKRSKYWNGESFQTTEWTDSDLSDKLLSEWWGDLISGWTETIFETPLNDTDLKWRRTYNKAPYFEIIQDPYSAPVEGIDKNKLELRNFGSDPYYLNNGSKINIEWSNGGGKEFSDNWQRELNGSIIRNTSIDDIKKTITLFGASSSFTIAIESSKDTPLFIENSKLDNRYIKKEWIGKSDKSIIDETISMWRQVYQNNKLDLTTNWDFYGSINPTLDYISPIISITGATGTTESGMTVSTGLPGATGASASAKISGRYIFDVTKEGYLININLGELTILEKETIEDPFVVNNFEQTDDYGNPVQLSEEYLEGAFSGPEEEFIVNLNQIDDEPVGPNPEDGFIDTESSKPGPGPILGSKLTNSSGTQMINLGGHRLKLVISDLEKYLKANGFPGAKIGNNGIMRNLKDSAYPSSPARAAASLHGAGLAVDITFNIPGKIWKGIGDNVNLSTDEKLTKTISNWVKTQSDLVWGAQWGKGSNPSAGIVNARGITEYHHFEIKSSEIPKYWEPVKEELSKLGFKPSELISPGTGSKLHKLMLKLIGTS